MNRRSWLVILSVVALFSLVAAACGDDDDDDGGVTIVGGPTATSPAAGGPPTATPGDDGGETPENGDETPANGEETPADNGEDGDLVAQGEELYTSLGCQGCHSTDGSDGIGPTFQGLYGSEETLQDGSTVTVDDAYIEESIRDPSAAVVEGFQEGIMPQFDNLSDEEISALIAFIQAQS